MLYYKNPSDYLITPQEKRIMTGHLSESKGLPPESVTPAAETEVYLRLDFDGIIRELQGGVPDNTAPVALIGTYHPGNLVQCDSYISVDQPNIIVSAVKRGEDSDDLVIRCYETSRNATRATIHLPNQPQTVTLDGSAVADYQWSQPDSTAIIKIPACGETPRVLTIICRSRD